MQTGSRQPKTILQSIQGTGPNAQYFSQETIEGDWIAETQIVSAGDPAHAAVLFATQSRASDYVALHVYFDRVELIRQSSSKSKVLSSCPGAGPPPWQLRVRKRGAYYFFHVNGTYCGFTIHPSGDLATSGRDRSLREPKYTRFGISFPSAGRHELRKMNLIPISFGTRQARPVVSPGPKGSWNRAEVFPGAVIEHQGIFHLYLNGTDWTSEKLEGGGNTRVGLAISENLYDWKVDARGAILGLGPAGSWDSTLVMVNGATRTAGGKFAVTFMGFNGKTWSGIGLATADQPAGPFMKHPENPVLRIRPGSWEKMIHEHALFKDGDRYILFYTGYDGRNGDRGGIAISKDLLHWTEHSSNAVFLTEGPNRWDSLHLRPRSLFRRGVYYYLFYEGAGTRPKFDPQEGGVALQGQLIFDSVGLARSKDLVSWERHPWNPAVAQTGETTFDALWTGWPHAILRPDGIYVLYAASDAWGFAKKQGRVFTGLIRFDYQELENWGQ